MLQGKGYAVALVTDGRMSGASGKVPAAIHVSPEAAEGGTIGLVEDGDVIEIDIPGRAIRLRVDDITLEHRWSERNRTGWKPAHERPRKVSTALRAYARFATSAAKGAVRVVD